MSDLYLGRYVDPKTMKPYGDYVSFKSDRLVQQAVCLGMTGSGKTGLCVSLLEHVAMNGIPWTSEASSRRPGCS